MPDNTNILQQVPQGGDGAPPLPPPEEIPRPTHYPTIDATTGDATTTPIEAVAKQHRDGKIKFYAGTRLPVKVNGVAGTIPAELYDEALEGGAEPNFDPNGGTKALAAALASGITLTGTDYAAEAGAWLGAAATGQDPHKAVEDARHSLSALREEHPGMDLLGTALSAVTPGGVAGIAGRIAKGVGLVRDAGEAAKLVQEGSRLQDAARAASAAAVADAQTGKLAGSALGKLLRYGNPYEAVGKVGEVVAAPVGKVLGKGFGSVAQLATEGALINAAGAVDEAELGDAPMTGETLYTSLEHGAIFGGSLGLVIKGGQKILTAAGSAANRLAEAAAGGSGRDYREAGKRWGWGSLGSRNLEEGMKPFESAHQGLERMQSVAHRDAQRLDEVVSQADSKYAGASAREIWTDAEAVVRDKAKQIDMVGGNSDKFSEPILHDLREHLGFRPEPPKPIFEENAAGKKFESYRIANGLPEESTIKPPRGFKDTDVIREARRMAKEEGLGNLAVETAGKRFDKTAFEAFERQYVTEVVPQRIAQGLAPIPPGLDLKKEFAAGLEAQVTARNARRGELQKVARETLNENYAEAVKTHDELLKKYGTLRAQAEAETHAEQTQKEFEHAHLLRQTQTYNDGLKVSLSHAREFRQALDKIIPWHRNKENAVLNAAIEMKQAIRGSIEGKVESEFDVVSKRGNADQLGQYLHAKARYGQAKDLERMYERATGSEGKNFGKIRGHLGYAVVGALAGHPGVGIAAGAGAHLLRSYGPSGGAFVLHKAARLAEIKALRTELEVAASRSAKAALSAAAPATDFATVAVPMLAPHQLKVTAADAMELIYKNSDLDHLRGRIAALHPDTVIIAPKASEELDKTVQRIRLFLLTRIPQSISKSLAAGEKPDPSALNQEDAQDFLDATAVTQDPRVAYDALSSGNLTSTQAVALSTAHPSNAAFLRATLQRQVSADRAAFNSLPSGKKYSIELITGNKDIGTTAMLQMNLASQQAAAKTATQGSTGGPRGMTNSKFDKSPLAGIAATQSQSSEGNPPGRRGRLGKGSLGGM